MSTCDSPVLTRPGPFSIRAHGCVLTDELFEEPVDPSIEAAKKKQEEERLRHQQEIEAVRKSTRAEMEKKMAEELAALQQRQQENWKRLNEELERTLKQLESDIRHQLIEMSVRISEIILCHKLPDADMMRRVLDEVLSPISDLQGVRVRMAPGAIEALSGRTDSSPLHPGLECVEDGDLKPGDIVVESRNGIFDGRLKSRLSELATALAQPPVDHSAEA